VAGEEQREDRVEKGEREKTAQRKRRETRGGGAKESTNIVFGGDGEH